MGKTATTILAATIALTLSACTPVTQVSTQNSNSSGDGSGGSSNDTENTDVTEPAPEETYKPYATTPKEAVAYSLMNYCLAAPADAGDPATWILMSAPVSPPVEGYWDVYAVSTSGMVTMRVTPDFDNQDGTVTAADAGGEGALEEWGCPTSMDWTLNEDDNSEFTGSD